MKANSADEPAGLEFSPHTHTRPYDIGDSATLDENYLLQEYTPALQSWAARYSRGDAQLRNDLFQEGALGLCQAARRFDPSRGVKFATLAWRYMRGRMLNYLRNENGHWLCIPLAQACHVAEDCDAETVPQEDCLPTGMTGALEQTERFLFEVDLRLVREMMQEFLALLTERQREIFRMRYVDGLQPSDVARAVGVSAARVTQVLSESVLKIQTCL